MSTESTLGRLCSAMKSSTRRRQVRLADRARIVEGRSLGVRVLSLELAAPEKRLAPARPDHSFLAGHSEGHTMARSPKATSSRAREQTAGRKKRVATARTSASATPKKAAGPRKGPAAKKQSTSKRTSAQAPSRRAQPPAASWATGLGSLLISQPGREILAEVLNAAAGVLRQSRETGQQVQQPGQAMIDRSTDLASTAVQVSSEVASGAVDTGIEITAAAVDMVQTAAGTLATVSTNAVLDVLPGRGTGENEEQPRRDGPGSGRSRTDEG
jgi:hypothetical protein